LISRGWRGVADGFNSTSASNGKQFVRQIGLLIIDEIHLLGEERGAVLEAIVSRTRFISQYVQAEKQQQSGKDIGPVVTRIMGLSTALANPYGMFASVCIFKSSKTFITSQLHPNIYLLFRLGRLDRYRY
jgi:activating signal cointegrator complex subunit 3